MFVCALKEEFNDKTKQITRENQKVIIIIIIIIIIGSTVPGGPWPS